MFWKVCVMWSLLSMARPSPLEIYYEKVGLNNIQQYIQIIYYTEGKESIS